MTLPLLQDSIDSKIEYKWNENFGNAITKIDINLVIKELETIGDITPEAVVDLAKNKESVLHDYFEWNNKKAAESYRLQQASGLLRRIDVVVIKGEEKIETRWLEIETRAAFTSEIHYKKYDELTPENIELVRKSILNELIRIKKRLGSFDSFNDAIGHLEGAIDSLNENFSPIPGTNIE